MFIFITSLIGLGHYSGYAEHASPAHKPKDSGGPGPGPGPGKNNTIAELI